MTFAEFQQWAFLGIVTYGTYVLREMNKNMASLNEKVAVLMAGHEESGKKFDDHESRIRTLEQN